MIKRLGLIAICALLAGSLVACEDKAEKKVEVNVQPATEHTQPQQAPVQVEVKSAEPAAAPVAPAAPANDAAGAETQAQP